MKEVLYRGRSTGGLAFLLLCLSAPPVGTQSLASEAPVYDLAANGSLDARVTQLERKLDSRNQPQVHQKLAELQSEIELLRGAVERNHYEWQKAAKKQERLEELLRSRGIAVESDSKKDSKKDSRKDASVATDSLMPIDLPSRSSGGSLPMDSEPHSEQSAYKSAVQLVLEQKQYDKAAERFERFISAFPDSSYISNAHHWLGKIYLKLGNKDKSEKNFTVVVNKFPQSVNGSPAMLQLAYILQARGDQESAKVMFRRIIQSYTTSAEAEIARAQLIVLLK